MLAGAAAKKYMLELEKKQEILMNLADMLIHVFTAESIILRTKKLVDKSTSNSEYQIAMTQCYVNDALEKMYLSGKHLLAEFAEDDMLIMMHMGLKRFTKYPIINTLALKKKIAKKLIEEKKYCF